MIPRFDVNEHAERHQRGRGNRPGLGYGLSRGTGFQPVDRSACACGSDHVPCRAFSSCASEPRSVSKRDPTAACADCPTLLKSTRHALSNAPESYHRHSRASIVSARATRNRRWVRVQHLSGPSHGRPTKARAREHSVGNGTPAVTNLNRAAPLSTCEPQSRASRAS